MSHNSGGKIAISNEALQIGALFQLNDVEREFFNSLVAHLMIFDEYHSEKQKSYSKDIEYILRCATNDLASSKHQNRSLQRFDAYLYIYRRIERYMNSNENKNYPQLLHEFKNSLLRELVCLFKETRGEEPNLIIDDREPLSTMNIPQHLSCFTSLNDIDTLRQFLLLCKLSMQATRCLIANDYRPQWIDILSKIKEIKIHLENFIHMYLIYEKAFEQFPIDEPTLIYLIQRFQVVNRQNESLFMVYIKYCSHLKLDTRSFLTKFQSMFLQIIEHNQVEMTNIIWFLCFIDTVDQQLFETYFTSYSYTLEVDGLWKLFFKLTSLNIIRHSLMGAVLTRLNEKILALSVLTFCDHLRTAQSYRTTIKKESLSSFDAICELLLDNFINKQIHNPNYSYQFTQQGLTNLLQFSIIFSSPGKLHNTSLILLRRLLFNFDDQQRLHAQKLRALFDNLNHLDVNQLQQYNFEEIIKDDWLRDVVNSNLQIWLKLDRNSYQYLCDNHRNNPWIIHIWSRILNISFSKMINIDSNQILAKIDDWLKTVQHNVPVADDILTNMLVYQLCDIFLFRTTRSILSLPRISVIIDFIIAIAEREDSSDKYDITALNVFVTSAQNVLTEILHLKSKCFVYRDLLTGSIIDCFLSSINLQAIVKQNDSEHYCFPLITEQIDAIVGLPKSNIIDVNSFQSPKDFYDKFLPTVIQWLDWSDRFVDIFQYIVAWLKNHNVQRSNQILIDLLRIRDDQQMTLFDIRAVIERTSKLLQPFKDLRRLCHLFNCLISFENVNPGALNKQEDVKKFLLDMKRFQPNNSFTVDAQRRHEQIIVIGERQQIQWNVVSEGHSCDVHVEYRPNGTNMHYETLYRQDNASIHTNILQGTFETQRSGHMIITIDNTQSRDSRTIWYRIKSVGLSICQLFHGIFNMLHKKYYSDALKNVSEQEMSRLLETTFQFIDKLLSGDLKLDEMTELSSIFYDKNINMREEVSKLFHNRFSQETNRDNIEQVCEWLQIYQYYSHLNVIMECIERFDLLPKDNEEETIGHLKRLRGNENCSLKDITQAYRILQERFQDLTHQHLQLIKTVVKCSPVIQTMRAADLYSLHGQRRFQELRDNLTTQFQLQEFNNTILNSWIVTYKLIKPFINKANNFNEFITRLAESSNLEESSLNHIKVVNDNLQLITMWLSTKETSVLDNALIMMVHLYKNATVHITLQELVRKPSFYEIHYSIDQTYRGEVQQDQPIEQQVKKIDLILSMSDIENHKRQLTFCNVDTQQNLIYKKALINGQLKLLKAMDHIYQILLKLELAGHPDYQLHQKEYEIDLQEVQISSMSNDLRNHQNARICNAIENRIRNLESICSLFQQKYDGWIKNLEKSRRECPFLQLYSNRQIMVLILLLRKPDELHSVRNRFLKNLFTSKNLTDQKEEEHKLTIHCLQHYLRSLRIKGVNLSNEHLNELHQKYQIEQGLDTENPLSKLSKFLCELFENNMQLFRHHDNLQHNKQQFHVKLPRLLTNSSQVSLAHDFDLSTCCILLNIFQNQLPAPYQILWCSNATKEDIELFFTRIRTFPSLIFAIMNIDKMHHNLREIVLQQQDQLAQESSQHGRVYFFSRDLTTNRKGLYPYAIPDQYKDPQQAHQHLMELFSQCQLNPLNIQIIYGKAGIGKTHQINTRIKTDQTSSFSINDQLNLSSLISSFLLFDVNISDNGPSIFFNISIHAPFEDLNRTLFSLFISGCLSDPASGLIFSLSDSKPWKFIIEVPYSNNSRVDVRENLNEILPILAVVSPTTLEEVTDENYQLSIGNEEELVARFFKAFSDGKIDQLLAQQDENGPGITFEKVADKNQCRQQISNCIKQYAPKLARNKIYELSFVKFLYRRFRFFEGPHYRFNQCVNKLGSTAIQQMIKEAITLTEIDFSDAHYPRVYFVYDPGFALRLLHVDWNQVSSDIKTLFNNRDPLKSEYFVGKDYYAECLAWLIDIKYENFMKIIQETKFILTDSFAYKLFHIHERKLTKLPLIIEGDTGVGKTFLLQFYSKLLNSTATSDVNQKHIYPQIIDSVSQFLRETIETRVENQTNLLNSFLQQIKPKVLGLDVNEGNFNEPMMALAAAQPVAAAAENILPTDDVFLRELKISLGENKYDKKILYQIWKTLLQVCDQLTMPLTNDLIGQMRDYICEELSRYPLLKASKRLDELRGEITSPTSEVSIDLFKEYLYNTQIKDLFYRLLLHPGISEEQVVEFVFPIIELARQLSKIEIVVFFDELNTSSCLGLFKEMFMDGTLHGTTIPKNIFFTAAINPYMKTEETRTRLHRNDFIVHDLPQSLKDLKVAYGALESRTLADYIVRKIAMFQSTSSGRNGRAMLLDDYVQDTLADSILKAQDFCEKNLGRNIVSQREIQRCFTLIEFFWNLRYDDELLCNQRTFDPNPIKCIALAIALIYYFRLPTKDHNVQRRNMEVPSPSREQLAELLNETIPDFEEVIQTELYRFVNTDNFVIPKGVAINQAVREHIFAIVVSLITRTPLCIIGIPGQSKTLSFQIVLQNLQGAQLSSKPFCKRLPAFDAFYCLGSKYTRSEDIASIFDRAIRREQEYEQNQMNMRCVVFLDEASLPDEKKMVMKVLHPYLDDCKVAFVAVANHPFDAANANRMICIQRSLPSEVDQKILAYGCLGLQLSQKQATATNRLDKIISGLCQGYRQILSSPDIPHIFHDRDFIYMLRELRFELTNINQTEEVTVGEITPGSLLRALEDNFHGVRVEEFNKLVDIFAESIGQYCPEFRTLINDKHLIERNIPIILRNSMKLDPVRRRLYGRYKLIIDESEDESAIRLLYQTGIIDTDPQQTTVFRMSDFDEDLKNDLRNVEILSTIKLCMETGKTILMVNTGRIHGSLYDVFNQNFSIMATDESRKIFSKVAIGPKTIDVVVHENFQCIVHIKRSEFQDIPAPFLSRFQKYSLSAADFYSIQVKELPVDEQNLMRKVESIAQSFVKHFGQEYFYGFNDNTFYSTLLSFITRSQEGECYLSNMNDNYNQLSIQSKLSIEQSSNDKQQCLLYGILSKFLQLASPESMIFKLPTLENDIAQVFCRNYFYQQEHFNIETFLIRFVSPPIIPIDNDELLKMDNAVAQPTNTICMVRKLMLFTRTSSFILRLSKQSMNELFNHDVNDDMMNSITSDKIDMINLSTIQSSNDLHEQFEQFENVTNKSVLLIIIDGRINHQRIHIPYVRQLVDQSESICNKSNEQPTKFYVLLIHNTGQELNHQSCFPAMFLHHWDCWYLDTSTPGNAFHLQKMLQVFTSKFVRVQQQITFQDEFYVLNALFDDCLLEFCSRAQVGIRELPKGMFHNGYAYEFYRRQTSIDQRLQCLKSIFREVNHLQKHLLTIFHENISMKDRSLQKNCNIIHDIAKDTLCGKNFRGLVDSLQSNMRVSFTNFISYMLKYLIDDYGLETLTKLSDRNSEFNKLLELVDYSSYSTNVDQSSSIDQGPIRLNDHYSCILQTPLFHLLRQRIRNLAGVIKSKIVQPYNRYEDDGNILRDDYYNAPDENAANDENEIDQYHQRDLLSIYTACRIMENLDIDQSFYENLLSDEDKERSQIREILYESMFRRLWIRLNDLCRNNNDYKQWLQSYTLISKYYPSERVLKRMEFVKMKAQIDFMNLSYFILLNQKTPQPTELVQRLLTDTGLTDNNADSSICLQYVPLIIRTIDRYFEEHAASNATLLIDIQQWIIMTLKGSDRSSQQEVNALLKFLCQPTCHLSLPMKQFIFDELMNISVENSRQNRLHDQRQFKHFWDRLSLLTLIMNCVDDEHLNQYQLPSHPSMISDENQSQILLDLFFFHLRRLASDEIPQLDSIHKIMFSSVPRVNDARHDPIVEKIFTDLKEYFTLRSTALLLSQPDIDNLDEQRMNNTLNNVINKYLTINPPVTQLSKSLEVFCGTIIQKRSWNFLLSLLKSERIQRLNAPWADTLHSLFESNENLSHKRCFQHCHQLHFVLTPDTSSSIFPTLHQPYQEIKQLLAECVTNNDLDQRWIPLTDWIQTKLNSNPLVINAIEIKVMLLLNIYYEYFCTNKIDLLDQLLAAIDNTLQPCEEERRIFRIFLQPEQYVIGYVKDDNHLDSNCLNDLFRPDCIENDELSIRHLLVNLLAMIMLGGKENFLWTFAFSPLTLQGTFGFGSTRHEIILANGVHYDCGCLLTEQGELIHFASGGRNGSPFSVPAVYIAYFATYGAMAWHLLLYEESVSNLYGPILAKHAIDTVDTVGRIAGNSMRAKVCHFVRTRYLSTYHHLSMQLNEDNASILFNRCFELFAQATRQIDQHAWIKPVYRTFQEKYNAEQEYQNTIFYPMKQQLAEHRKIIDTIQARSLLQTNLYDYVARMPILVDVVHFKTELCSPKASQLPLTILRRLLASLEFVQMTRYVYDLCQLYVLLHRTYAQLIDPDEFLTFTLKELYARAHQNVNAVHQEQNLKIIQNGIEAFNSYHRFADGLIQPGACDQTQRFEPISFDTFVSYLVETGKIDEGNMIMRILSILVDYHNDILKLLNNEIKENENLLGLGSLKDTIIELTEREISVLQITEENMGVITLNRADCQWIEQLTRASLENEKDYFPQSNTQLDFNFLYVQSYLIRTYLLYCRINYEHIQNKYQLFVRQRSLPVTTVELINNETDEDEEPFIVEEWIHLEQRTFDQLQTESDLLQQILEILKTSEKNYSSMKIADFVRLEEYQHRFAQLFQQCRMKDFPLSHISNVLHLYQQTINQFQYALMNVSQLLRVPIEKTLSDTLNHLLVSSFVSSESTTNKDDFQAKMKLITDFLNDTILVENLLADQYSRPLVETCAILAIENSILAFIPNEIKCENYLPLCMKLIEVRSQIQEQAINTEEKKAVLWSIRVDVQNDELQSANVFDVFRNKDQVILEEQNDTILMGESERDLTHIIPQLIGDGNSGLIFPEIKDPFDLPTTDVIVNEETAVVTNVTTVSLPISTDTNTYTSAAKLRINSKLFESSELFEMSLKQAEKRSKENEPKFEITHLDGKTKKTWRCKSEHFYGQLKDIFAKQKYDFETVAVIDSHDIFVNFQAENVNVDSVRIQTQYRVLERSSLISVNVKYGEKELTYFITMEGKLSSVLSYFILDLKSIFLTSKNPFIVFDELGRCLMEDRLISELYRSDENTPVQIHVVQCNEQTNFCCQVTFIENTEDSQSECFMPTTLWKQMNLWLKSQNILAENAKENYCFWYIEQQCMIDNNQSLSSVLNQ
ncbi:unnamed protein product, partial [Adineta ricciae]